MLTLFLTVYAGLIAIPLGILLALGRRSRLPLIRFASVVFIEFWRGVPIITVIFLLRAAALIMPTGFDVTAWRGRHQVVIAAYGGPVRGGLQALPESQPGGAGAGAGLLAHPAHDRAAPGAASRCGDDRQFISLFKSDPCPDRLDLRPVGYRPGGAGRPGLGRHEYEAYVYAGAIYWFACFGLSQWSRLRGSACSWRMADVGDPGVADCPIIAGALAAGRPARTPPSWFRPAPARR